MSACKRRSHVQRVPRRKGPIGTGMHRGTVVRVICSRQTSFLKIVLSEVVIKRTLVSISVVTGCGTGGGERRWFPFMEGRTLFLSRLLAWSLTGPLPLAGPNLLPGLGHKRGSQAQARQI